MKSMLKSTVVCPAVALLWIASSGDALAEGRIEHDRARKLITMADGSSGLVLRLSYDGRRMRIARKCLSGGTIDDPCYFRSCAQTLHEGDSIGGCPAGDSHRGMAACRGRHPQMDRDVCQGRGDCQTRAL